MHQALHGIDCDCSVLNRALHILKQNKLKDLPIKLQDGKFSFKNHRLHYKHELCERNAFDAQTKSYDINTMETIYFR